MKRCILIILLLFFCFGFSAGPTTGIRNIPDHNLADQGNNVGRSVKNIIDATDPNRRMTLTLAHIIGYLDEDTIYYFNTNETIPSNITLKVEPGVKIDGSATLTINGPFEAGLTKCFGDSITVVFGDGAVEKICPEWWGAKSDSLTDNSTAFSYIEDNVYLLDGNYMMTDVELPSELMFLGSGFSSILKQNSLAGDFVIGNTGSAESELILDKLVIDGNKELGTFTGAGHGFKIDHYSKVDIGFLEVKNSSGHGLVIGTNCQKVTIGRLLVHDNEKFGVRIESNLADAYVTQYINIGEIIAYENNWTGVSIADNYSDLTRGVQNINIGSIISYDNLFNGVALGTNATGGNFGSVRVQIEQVQAHSNNHHGIEIFGAYETQIGSILSYGNTKNGVYIEFGDDTNTPVQHCQIGNIITHSNVLNGLLIGGVDKLYIDNVETYNNDANNADYWAGIYFYPGTDSPGTKNIDIHIGNVLAYDDQVSATQKYGVWFAGADTQGPIVIDYLRAYDNTTYDLCSTSNYRVDIGKLDVGTMYPRFSDNIDGGGVISAKLKVDDHFFRRGRTTDATQYTLVRLPIPDNTYVMVKGFVYCVDPNNLSGDRANYELTCGAMNDSTTTTLVGSVTAVHTAESAPGIDATFSSGGAGSDYINVRITGKAATYLDWEGRFKIMDMKEYGI